MGPTRGTAEVGKRLKKKEGKKIKKTECGPGRKYTILRLI
jgi:hypothetical protein